MIVITMFYRWEKLIAELQVHAPTLLNILYACTSKDRQNRNGTIGMCIAMILKLRYPRMSLVQKIISVILLSGNTSKQVCYHGILLLCHTENPNLRCQVGGWWLAK